MLMAVQRLRVEHCSVVEMSGKLVQERLDMEQQAEDLQVTHMNRIEQIRSRRNQFISYQTEHLSGVGEAVIQDVKMLRTQFRMAKQEVDSLESKLQEMEKRDSIDKEHVDRANDENQ